MDVFLIDGGLMMMTFVGFIVKPRCERRESEVRCDLDTRALERASELKLLREPPEP